MGVAGLVEGERCVVTNSHWALDGRELRPALAIERLNLINDFEAIAWSLPSLTAKDVRPLGGGKAVSNEPMVVIGPGTGLGMAAFLPRKVGAVVVATEGGHATLPAGSTREDAAIEQLRQHFGHVSAERALSGAGLENLYRAIAGSEYAAVPERNAAEITQHALDGTCKISRAATDMFCAMLGSVAGNLALMFRARGGVYIAGGIAPRLVDYLAKSEFRARFVAKGRFRTYLDAVPTSVIVHEDAAFLGLQSLAHNSALQ
jgi:glucokinase